MNNFIKTIKNNSVICSLFLPYKKDKSLLKKAEVLKQQLLHNHNTSNVTFGSAYKCVIGDKLVNIVIIIDPINGKFYGAPLIKQDEELAQYIIYKMSNLFNTEKQLKGFYNFEIAIPERLIIASKINVNLDFTACFDKNSLKKGGISEKYLKELLRATLKARKKSS
jgi:hypothetical protein